MRASKAKAHAVAAPGEAQEVFQTAAELFAVLSTPVRLQVLSALCDTERSVNELATIIGCSQPNLSQHLNVLYRSGLLAKRREGTQIIYRVQSARAMAICRSVCTQIAIEISEPERVAPEDRLVAVAR